MKLRNCHQSLNMASSQYTSSYYAQYWQAPSFKDLEKRPSIVEEDSGSREEGWEEEMNRGREGGKEVGKEGVWGGRERKV